jgi:hypothetical protein
MSDNIDATASLLSDVAETATNGKPRFAHNKNIIAAIVVAITLLTLLIASASLIVASKALIVACKSLEISKQQLEQQAEIGEGVYPMLVAGARVGTSGDFKNDVTVKPGDVVMVKLIVRNTARVKGELMVHIGIPNGLTLDRNNIYGFNALNPEGEKIDADAILDWKNLGAHNVYDSETHRGETVITYFVRVDDSYTGRVANIVNEVASYANGKRSSDTIYQYVSIYSAAEYNATPPVGIDEFDTQSVPPDSSDKPPIQ